MQRTAQIFVLLGIASLFWRRGIIKPYTLQPFEFFMILGGITLAVFFILYKEERKRLKPLAGWLWFFLALILFTVAGSINGYRTYGMNAIVKEALLIDFFYVAISALAFLLVFFFSKETWFRQYAVFAFLSPLLLTPFLFFPNLADKLGIVGGKTHFLGLTTNPSDFALLSFFSFGVLVFSLLKTNKIVLKTVLWVFIVSSVSFILWSGSRTAWLSIAGIAILAILFALSKYNIENRLHKKIERIALFILLAMITVSISFFVLPHRAKIMVLDRIFPQITNYNPAFFVLDKITLAQAVGNIRDSGKIQIPYQRRQEMWPQALRLMLIHPVLGLGPAYDILSNKIKEGNKTISAHNTFLEAMLTGGVGLLLLLLLVLRKTWRQFKNAPRDYEFFIVSSMILSAFLFFLVGDYLFSLPWMWIPFALLLGRNDAEFSNS